MRSVVATALVLLLALFIGPILFLRGAVSYTHLTLPTN